MEIGQLEAFLAVVREGSFTRAATRLNLTQPSLSARIQQLERSLGGSLLHRNQRPVEPTALGKIFLSYAERAINILDVGFEVVQTARLGLAGRVSICCPNSLATYLIPQVVMRFTADYPGIELSIEAANSHHSISQLLSGEVNLAFSAAFPHHVEQVQTIMRLKDVMVPTAPASHPLAQKKAIALEELWDFQLIFIHWGKGFESYMQSLYQIHDALPRILRVPLPAAWPLVEQTGGITFMPSRLAAVSGFNILNVSNFRYDWDAILATRPNRVITTVEQTFVESVRQVWEAEAGVSH